MENETNNRDKRLRNIWHCMKRRCSDPNHVGARWYYEKGIRVCEEWEKSYTAFREWALENGYQETLTLDRIDSDKGYCPENCQWISKAENSKKAAHGINRENPQNKIHEGIPHYFVYQIPEKKFGEFNRDCGLNGIESALKRYGVLVGMFHRYHDALVFRDQKEEKRGEYWFGEYWFYVYKPFKKKRRRQYEGKNVID